MWFAARRRSCSASGSRSRRRIRRRAGSGLAAGGACAARLVVGQRATRRPRPQRAAGSRRHFRAKRARRHRADPALEVRAARAGRGPTLRPAPLPRARPARAAARPLAAAGRPDRSVVTVRLPRPPKDGFDETTWLRRHGVHVVLRADRWRQIGRRGGLGGVADRLRRALAGSIAPGLHGERRGVVEGVVLGDEQSLSDEPAAAVPGLGPLPPAGGLGPERRPRRRRRAGAGVAARPPALARPARRARRDRRLRARGRSAAVRDPRRVSRGARLARLARGAPGRPLALLPARRARPARAGTRTRCSTRASSSRSRRWRRSSCSFRGC